MKNKVLISITIIALFSASFCMFMLPVNAQGNAGTITSKAFLGEITLDGKYDEQDWHNVNPRSFTLYDWDDPTIEREIEVASIHNDTTLFIWISVDETETESGSIYLIFQSTNGPIVVNPTVPSWSDGNDVKHIASNNYTFDGYMSSDSALTDGFNEGTTDFEGKCYTRSGGLDFEVATPLDSGDINGGDVSLMEGDSINMFLIYFPELSTGTGTFSLIQSTDVVWEQIRVELEEYSYWKIPSYSIPILLFSMLAVSMFLIFKYNSHNKNK